MKKIPSLAVCVPCYNAQDYISGTIASIIHQTYRDFTLYIIDNQSTDQTLNKVRQFRDKRLVILQNKKNIGMFPNMNKCLLAAKSPFVKIICADDVIAPDQFRLQVKTFNDHPDAVLVYNASNVITEQGSVIMGRRFMNRDRKINGGVLINKILKTGRNPVGEPTGIMIRRSVIEKYHLRFNDTYRYISDLDLWINILKHGNGYYINQILSSFRFHRSSQTAWVYKKAVQEHLKMVALHAEEFNLTLLDHILIYFRLVYFLFIKLLLIKFI